MKSDLNDFKKYLKTIRSICNPALSSAGLDDSNVNEIFMLIKMPRNDDKKLHDYCLRDFINIEIH
jgi:hypothetical protein